MNMLQFFDKLNNLKRVLRKYLFKAVLDYYWFIKFVANLRILTMTFKLMPNCLPIKKQFKASK